MAGDGFFCFFCACVWFFFILLEVPHSKKAAYTCIFYFISYMEQTKDMAHSEEIIIHIKFNHKNILCTYKEYHYIQLNWCTNPSLIFYDKPQNCDLKEIAFQQSVQINCTFIQHCNLFHFVQFFVLNPFYSYKNRRLFCWRKCNLCLFF